MSMRLLLVLAPVLLAGVLAAVVYRLRRAVRSRETVTRVVQTDLTRAEVQLREQMRQLARMRVEQRALSHLFRVLPDVVGHLNRADLSLRGIPKVLARLAEAVFEPEQVLLFVPDARGQEMTLVLHEGVSESSASRMTVKVGEGRVGWVAEHKVEMLAEDWLNPTRTEGRGVPENHPALRLDLVAPLVQGDRLFGVLSIGGPRQRLSDERLMLQMIANLGSIAYTHVLNMGNLRNQADHDGLTGLRNKRSFMKRLGELVIEAERSGQNLGLFIFDIDHFKHYNDSHGHLAGDEVLRGVARVLKEQVRPEDEAGRYGGEEFVVAMPQTEETAAMQVAERIRVAIASTPFARSETQILGRLTISGGVAVFPTDANSGTELLQIADQGLYQAKGSGRDRVVRSRGVQMGEAAQVEDEELAWSPGTKEP